MDFFIISQDKRITRAIQPTGNFAALTDPAGPEAAELPVQYYLKESRIHEYLDFIETPGPLAADRLKKLLAKYDSRLEFRPVVLADLPRMRQDLYWQLLPPVRECLAPQTEFLPHRVVKTLVLDAAKVGSAKVFKVAGILEPWTLVSLEVAESILRRDLIGMRFHKIACA
ncbi:MAG: serine protease [Bacillota bacterium]